MKQHAFLGTPLNKVQQRKIKGGQDPDTDVIYVQCGRGQAIGDWEVIPAEGYYEAPTEACMLHCGRSGVFACLNWDAYVIL